MPFPAIYKKLSTTSFFRVNSCLDFLSNNIKFDQFSLKQKPNRQYCRYFKYNWLFGNFFKC